MSTYKRDLDAGLPTVGSPEATRYIHERSGGSIRQWQPICHFCQQPKPCGCDDNPAAQANRTLCGEEEDHATD